MSLALPVTPGTYPVAVQLEPGVTAQAGKVPRLKNVYPHVLIEKSNTALQRTHMTRPALI